MSVIKNRVSVVKNYIEIMKLNFKIRNHVKEKNVLDSHSENLARVSETNELDELAKRLEERKKNLSNTLANFFK